MGYGLQVVSPESEKQARACSSSADCPKDKTEILLARRKTLDVRQDDFLLARADYPRHKCRGHDTTMALYPPVSTKPGYIPPDYYSFCVNKPKSSTPATRSSSRIVTTSP